MNKKLKETLIIEGVKFLFSWLGSLFDKKKNVKNNIKEYKKLADNLIMQGKFDEAKKHLEYIKDLEKGL